MKIPLVGAELFCGDGRTDMTKLIVTFRNFANVPKNVYALCVCVCDCYCVNVPPHDLLCAFIFLNPLAVTVISPPTPPPNFR